MSQQKEKNQNKLKGTQELYQLTELKTMKPFEELTFSDSFLFGEVMMDENICRNVLEIILGIEIEKVVVLEKEKQERNTPEMKGIRMDIYVKDMENTVYNVEMQVQDKKDMPKRSRYYQGILDTKCLPSGSKTYNILNKSFVIFICHFDPFGAKKCCYTFEERCVEDLSISLGDETQKIFLNTLGENRDEVSPILAEFLDYLKNPTTMKLKNKKIVELDNRVNQIKIDAKVRSRYMTLKEWLDDMVEQEVDFIREKIKEQVEEEVREQVEEEVREQVEEEVREQVEEEVREQVEEEVRERVKEEVRERVEEEVRERVEEVRQEGKIEGQIQLLRKFYIKGYNVEKTAELIEVEEDFVNEVYEVLQKYPEYDDEKIVTMYIQKRKEYNNN